MKRFKKVILSLMALFLVLPMATVSAEEDFKIMVVTDVGGIDDKSFSQGAWEGAIEWAEEHGDKNLAAYLHPQEESEYFTHLANASQADYDLIFGVGYRMAPTLEEVALDNPDQKYAMIDAVVDQPNVASMQFKDEEAAFLAGVVAASTTKSNIVGFVGGTEGVVIDKFEAGFVKGVKEVNPDIEILIQYAGSFVDAPKGRQIAASMFSQGADVIFHASGPTGNGVFSEAKDLVKEDPERELWVIGVDSDQHEEGYIEGMDRNVTLTSTLKQTGNALKSFANQTMEEGFKADEYWYGLENDGVGLAEGQLTDELKELVEEYKEKVVSGEIEVPEKPERKE